MPRVQYDNIWFDSEMELDYYKHLRSNIVEFIYQDKLKTPIKVNLGRRKNYTPDFIVFDNVNKEIVITELKGYSKWNGNEDDNIMNFMKHQVEFDQDFLIDWLKENDEYRLGYTVNYKRLKFLKGHGFVDYDFKNPNSRINVLRRKNEELNELNKYLNKELKDYRKYFKLMNSEKKLTKTSKEWLDSFVENTKKEMENL